MKKRLSFYLMAISRALGLSAGARALNFTPFQVPGTDNTAANDINNKDQFVGATFSCCFSNLQGFERFPNGSFLTFVVPGADETFAAGIYDNGNIVGTFLDTNEVEPFTALRQVPLHKLMFPNHLATRPSATESTTWARSWEHI